MKMQNLFFVAAVLPLAGVSSVGLRGNVRDDVSTGDPGSSMYTYHAPLQGGGQDPGSIGGAQGGGGGMPPIPGGIGAGGMGGGAGGGIGVADVNGGISYGSAEAPGGVSPAKTNADGSIAYPSAYKDVREAAVMSEQFQSSALQAAIAGDQHNGIVDDSAETMQQMALKRQMAATQAMRKSTNGVLKMSSLMQNHDASYSDVLSAVDWMSMHNGEGENGTEHLYRNDHQSVEDVRKQGQYDGATTRADSLATHVRAGSGVSSKSGWNADELPMTRAAAAAAAATSSSTDGTSPKSDHGNGEDVLPASAVMQSVEAQRSDHRSATPKKKTKKESKAEKKLDRTLEKLKADLQAAENIHPDLEA